MSFFSATPVTIRYVTCPKHGTHNHTVQSMIKGHEGTWCTLCIIESYGPPLPYELRPLKMEEL